MTSTEQDRVSKREFISRIAARTGQPIRIVRTVYEGIFGELTDAASRDEVVVLTGIGRFYRQDHKGHKVRFGKSDVDDYSVLKFSASRSLNRHLDEEAMPPSVLADFLAEDEDEEKLAPAAAVG